MLLFNYNIITLHTCLVIYIRDAVDNASTALLLIDVAFTITDIYRPSLVFNICILCQQHIPILSRLKIGLNKHELIRVVMNNNL